MSNADVRIWPYSQAAAIIAAPIIWAFLAVLFYLSRTYLQWPGSGDNTPLLFFSIILSVTPLILMLVDFVALKGAVIGSKWISVDFSKTVVESVIARRESFSLPDNILSEEESITDTGGTKITAAIKKATATEVVCIDLKGGNAWWVTRLLALCVGAVSAGSPKVIVFIGKRENRERTFMGWGMPGPLLEAMLDASPQYQSRVQKARIIARQIALFGKGGTEFPFQLEIGTLRNTLALPEVPPTQRASARQNMVLHQTVLSRAWNYDENESAMLTKILLAELRTGTAPTTEPESSTQEINLESPPDRLTPSRLYELFDRCLYRDSIDRLWTNDQQLSTFLDSVAPYIAIVRRNTYEGLLRSDFGERAIIRELFANIRGNLNESRR